MTYISKLDYHDEFIKYCKNCVFEDIKAEEIQPFLTKRPNINIYLIILTTLSGASSCGRLDILKYLVSLYLTYDKYLIDYMHDWLSEAFYYACNYGNLDIVKYILSLDNKFNDNKYIYIHIGVDVPFQSACANGHLHIVKYLLLDIDTDIYKKIDIHSLNNKAFRLACQNGRLDVIKYLLFEIDIDIYGKIDIHSFSDEPFCDACEYGRLEVIKYLLSDEVTYSYGPNKIDIHAQSDFCIRFACRNGHLEVVKYLLSLDPNIYEKIDIRIYGDNAFQRACEYNQLEVVKYLCEICDEYSYKINDDKIIPIIGLINTDELKTIQVDDIEEVKCLICYDTNDIISLNCNEQNSDKDSSTLSGSIDIGLSHYYCLSCYYEIYERYQKCSFCMKPINKSKLRKVILIG